MSGVERRAAAMVAARCAGWRELGLVAAELTWMDNDVPRPAPLLRDRGQARRRMSLGVRVLGETEFGSVLDRVVGFLA